MIYIDGDDCGEFNRHIELTPYDTITVLTSAHNPAMTKGYAYAFARGKVTGLPIGFDHLAGASFSLPFDGWLISGGEPRSIEAATVAGDIRQVLKAIVGFEGEAKVTPDGLCPMVWVEGLSVTGEA